MTKAQAAMLEETHGTVIRLTTVLLGTNGDKGLIGEWATLKAEHAERVKDCTGSEAVAQHEQVHHRAADTRRSTVWDRVSRIGSLIALGVAIAVAVLK